MKTKQREKIAARLEMIAIHTAVKSHAQAIKITFSQRLESIDSQIGKLISDRKTLLRDHEEADANIKRSVQGIEKLTQEIAKLSRGPVSIPKIKRMETPKQKLRRLKRELAEATKALSEMEE